MLSNSLSYVFGSSFSDVLLDAEDGSVEKSAVSGAGVAGRLHERVS